MDEKRIYVAIDLKSFYASVECIDRNLDPMTTNLVVADESKTEKTICLAVSPSLKSYGIPSRPRLFEVIQSVNKENHKRKMKIPNKEFLGKSINILELNKKPSLEIDYIVAPPRMAKYIDFSTEIYKVYLKYIASEDIHVYSIDEVFMDVTHYLKAYKMTPREFAQAVIKDIYETIGITATAGIGTNLYLCKIAMDIVAKNIEPDENGVRIAELNEMKYRKLLWNHRPLTDFWRVGKGYTKKLEENGLYTMGDIARCSIGKSNRYYHNEDLLYKLFGVNAELLIDHAWGYEPCTMKHIKSYKPQTNSICSGQVLQYPYTFDKTRIVVREMVEMLTLDLVDRNLVTDQIVLTVGYDIENLTNPAVKNLYKGEVKIDNYGRKIPKNAHGTANLGRQTTSTYLITKRALELFDNIVDKNLLVRRISMSANHVVSEKEVTSQDNYEQLSMFVDYEELNKKKIEENQILERERKMQKAMLDIKKKFGKNAVLKGINIQDGSTAKERNAKIGGHKA